MSSADTLIQRFLDAIVNPFLFFLASLAVLVFLWGVFQMIYRADVEKEREQGRQNVLWGIIGFVIMVGAYGIIRIVKGTFGIP